MVWSDSVRFMLLTHDFFRSFLPEGQTIAQRGTTQAIICLAQESRDAVDRVAEAAKAAGGRIGFEPVGEAGFMYGRAFEDLDGHLIENMYMDMDAFAATQAEQVAA
jgi:predicted lactoylglutathione lyase